MFDIQNYGGFIMAILIFQMIPGPGTLAILNATARNGARIGMSAVFGTLVGDFIYMLSAVLGLAAVLNTYPDILASIQWFGVGYLCWLGWRLLAAPLSEKQVDVKPEKNSWIYFRQALAVSLTNPKVIMFFMAFFPLFLSAESHPVTLFAMMAHVTLISLLYQSGLVVVGNVAARRLSRCRYARLIATRLCGIALIGFGVKLALNNR